MIAITLFSRCLDVLTVGNELRRVGLNWSDIQRTKLYSSRLGFVYVATVSEPVDFEALIAAMVAVKPDCGGPWDIIELPVSFKQVGG